MNVININFLCILYTVDCASYNILGIFPYNGRSHHIFFSSLVEELSTRQHNVTVINYFPIKKDPNLHQITLFDKGNDVGSDFVNMEEHLNRIPAYFVNLFTSYDTAIAFEYIAKSNCEKLLKNEDVRGMIESGIKFDLVIVEQFVTDCGLALAYKLNAPTMGMTAHVLMPWTYSRLGAPNNPAFVPNHFFGTGTKPDLWNRIQSAIINYGFNMYYKYVIQYNDQAIVNHVYPEVPNLESLGNNMSLIMLNQYFPLTGSRLYGANVIEIGGMHIKEDTNLSDKILKSYLDDAKNGVVYISFGTVASTFPPRIYDEIMKFIERSDMTFIWKADNFTDKTVPKNVHVRKWLPQLAILCHPKVVAFITHSGMLSSSEAMHCGVPVVSIPLFGDQFANAASAVENGLGVTVDIGNLDEFVLDEALKTVLRDEYQNQAEKLSKLWKDRPMSPMNTAIYWIEYVAKYKGRIEMKPPTVTLALYQYLMLDVFVVLGFLTYLIVKFTGLVLFRQ